VGQLRIRPKGSAGGHNGLKNIISHLGSEVFTRIRVGVGAKRVGGDLVSHVLGSIDKKDMEAFEEAIENAAVAAQTIIESGTETAMNKFNTKKK
jgi:PTH1 family peptidyl-tRNA hydrolase